MKRIKKRVFVLSLLLFSTFLMASDSGDLLVPYDDDGFYGGAIILMLLLYVGLPLLVLSVIFGVVASFIFPKIFSEFKSLIMNYYNMELKKALIQHFIHLLIFTPLAFGILYLVYTIFDVTYLYLFMLLMFLYSSFVGFYLLLYALVSAHYKNWKKLLIALVLGVGVFLFFAPSLYVVFEPVYVTFYGDSQ